MGISFYREPVGEPGKGPFAGIFERKDEVYLGYFLGTRGRYDFESGGNLEL
jgi:hypothetical protein